MTNYEKLFQNQMRDPQFAKAYYEARAERIVDEMLDTLKDKITSGESEESLIQTIDLFRQPRTQPQFARSNP